MASPWGRPAPCPTDRLKRIYARPYQLLRALELFKVLGSAAVGGERITAKAAPVRAPPYGFQCNFNRGSVLRPMRSPIIISAVRVKPYSAIWCMRYSEM